MGFVRFVYDVLLIVGMVFFVPLWWLVYKKKGYDIGIRERLFPGKINVSPEAVWVHCASVGEIKTAMPMIEYISSKRPVFLTVFSPRAYRFAKENLNITVAFLPFDLSFLIKRFIRLNRPKVLVLVEGELWFNLVMVAYKHLPIISINTHVPGLILYKPVLNRISCFILKSKDDEQRLNSIGVKSDVITCGNLKILSKVNLKDVSFSTDRKIIIAGSTHHPEEKIILDVFKQIKKANPNLILIIAPRHVERVKEVSKLVDEMGFSYSLRTQTSSPETEVYIIDTVGELSSFYRFADVIFVGGTLSDVGGHNIFEPILAGKKVIIGKNHHKIDDLVEEAKKLGVIQVVKDKIELKNTIERFLRESNIDVDVKKLQADVLNCYKEAIDRWL